MGNQPLLADTFLPSPHRTALWPPSLYGSAAASPRAAADFRSKCESYTCAVLRDLDGLRTKCVLEASSGATSATAGTVGSRPLAIANAPLDVSVDPSHHAPWRGRPLPHIVHFMHKFKPWNPSMRALRRVHRASIGCMWGARVQVDSNCRGISIRTSQLEPCERCCVLGAHATLD